MRGKVRVIVNGEGCNPCTSKTAEQQIEEVIENAENATAEAKDVIGRMEQSFSLYSPDGNVEMGEQRSVSGETVYNFFSSESAPIYSNDLFTL